MKSFFVAFSAMAVVSIAMAANADTVLIDATTNNGSFESPSVGPGNYTGSNPGLNVYWVSDATPTGWVATGTALQTAGTLTSGVTGNQFANLDRWWGGTLVQTLDATYQANTIYTLAANVSGNAFGAGGFAYLRNEAADEQVYAAIGGGVAEQMTGMAPLVLNTADHPTWVGQQITVKFGNPYDSWLYVDNVRLTATSSIPEPSTASLLGFGLTGLLAYAWRKRR